MFRSELMPMITSSHPDPVTAVIVAIREACDGAADSYLLAGVLIEGAIHVISEQIAAERRAECGWAANRLMVDRLRAVQAI